MKAEEYLDKKIGKGIATVCDGENVKVLDLPQLLESYHKAKVESITDEEIKNHPDTPCNPDPSHEDVLIHTWYVEGAKWFKEKLLK